MGYGDPVHEFVSVNFEAVHAAKIGRLGVQAQIPGSKHDSRNGSHGVIFARN
jgi:hypothetical protein